MKTFHLSTLGCKVNHYESDQIATLLRSHGLSQVQHPGEADLRVVNTCSVTTQAASKSRQTVRQVVRLPVLNGSAIGGIDAGEKLQVHSRQRVIVTGCWATSDKESASKLPGVSAVITHHQNVAEQLDCLLSLWQGEDQRPPKDPVEPKFPVEPKLPVEPKFTAEPKFTVEPNFTAFKPPPEPVGDNGWIILARAPTNQLDGDSKPSATPLVKKKLAELSQFVGATTLPLLDAHQDSRQRGFLKVQDGCDAHCTYCIIPKLRPVPWSKPVHEVLEEARRLVGAGHVELVLTGIFLGAYGEPTALRRKQTHGSGKALANLIDALCTAVPGLRRLRLSSLEPGDLTEDLLAALRSHPQVVPHLHLPLQSGSDLLLHRMNRQYGRADFLRMIDRVNRAFDRPALTTDIIVGFPGETEEEFERTLEVVDHARFIHIHAFSFSPRPGTAAARWQRDFVRGPVVNDRIELLNARAADHSLKFRQQFLGQDVEILVERQGDQTDLRHGRCERYFPVYFDSADVGAGDCVRVRIDRVNAGRTLGTLLDVPVPMAR
jgi:MiaB/RimO family radical SAM methylthiotransferase